MADYHGAWRSNRFRVHDLPAFKAWIDRVRGVYCRFESEGDFVTLFPDQGWDTGALPDQIEMTSDELEEALDAQRERGLDPYLYGDDWLADLDFVDELQTHIHRDSICFLIGSGAEKLRYIGGWAYALRNPAFHGQHHLYIGLDEIYDRAEEIFGGKVELRDQAFF